MLSVTELQTELQRLLGNDVLRADIVHGELSVLVPRLRIADILLSLRDDPKILMSQLMDVCGADYPQRPERFDVIYNLLSLVNNVRLRLKVETDEQSPVPSAVGVFSSAGWFEREVWDLFGIGFSGNPDLRRILTDYGFEGHPLRKDFPLSGYLEVRYDNEQRRIVYEPVKLPQDFRNFDFLSPWEGMTDVQLPGDEKATVGDKK